MQSDAEITKMVLNGEKQAFAALVERYERPVRAVALNVLRDYHRADDAAQDAFVKAYEKLPGLRKPAAFGPWLMRITRRCALDSARRIPKRASLELQTAEEIESRDGRLDPDKQTLLAAVARLPEAEQQVIMLRYLGSNSVNEVARIAGRSVGTVTKQLSRAHGRLRKMLKEADL
ncbi:MAG: sigma-70 family RNA polymerase sigma factor [Sedimentisphaerales bacterium]|nr:sigma-70 family RNA polymerase sigma factor [Sedimentisphaerales bacterium]